MSVKPVAERNQTTWVPAVIVCTFITVVLALTQLAAPTSAKPAGSANESAKTAVEPTHAVTEARDVAVAAKKNPPQVVEYTLRTNLGGNPAMSFVGVGGAIEGKLNPTMTAAVGDTVRVNVVDGDGVMHDFTVPDLNLSSGQLMQKDQKAVVEFVARKPGEFRYYCNVPGHKDVGMAGVLKITGEAPAAESGESSANKPVEAPTAVPVQAAAASAVSVVRNPTDLPSPLGKREPMKLRIDLTTVEVTGVLADGTTYNYFTFDGKIPGPMLRIRVGDTVELHMKNEKSSLFPHSIDLHAVTGPGGGAVYTQTTPGGETFFTFQAINVGLYVYHCATASIPHHLANGMYGLILVEPEGGLPPVDREFYVMQADMYTDHPFGTKGHLNYDPAKASHEDAEYVVFNGSAGALTTDENALRAKVGETVRIYFGVGGPNYTSSFHVIGEIFDRVYDQASLTSEPLTNVQTTIVPPGGAVMVEFKVDVPGRYILVDHSLSRLERGLAGFLYVEGADQPAVFHGENANMAGH